LPWSISTPTNIGDVFSFDGSLHQLTHINEALFSQLNITEPEMIWSNELRWQEDPVVGAAPTGLRCLEEVSTHLEHPWWPHSAYGYTFDHEFQWMAAKGYIVLYPNPRGSTTYGQDFANVIQYNYPGDDY